MSLRLPSRAISAVHLPAALWKRTPSNFEVPAPASAFRQFYAWVEMGKLQRFGCRSGSMPPLIGPAMRPSCTEGQLTIVTLPRGGKRNAEVENLTYVAEADSACNQHCHDGQQHKTPVA
jgi:hypothetical protein